MDRAAQSFADGLAIVAVLLLVATLVGVVTLVIAVVKLRTGRPSARAGVAAILVGAVPGLYALWMLATWAEGGFKRGPTLTEWGVPTASALLFIGLGLAHVLAARRRQLDLLRDLTPHLE